MNLTSSVQGEQFAHLLDGNSFSTTSLLGVRFVSSLSGSLRNLYYALAVLSTVLSAEAVMFL